ncbi:hypothetical protein FACS189473_2090 [Spirochaetia bacterium]|nr:hypothetical protein FACS189473_2090 [Spirochaetia bacterium]
MPTKQEQGKTSQELEREAANLKGEAGREKEKAARITNAEKQKRFRQSMKAQGYKAKLIWEKPVEAGLVQAAAPVIHESSIGIAQRNPEVNTVLNQLSGVFLSEYQEQGIPREVWNTVYKDFQTMLKPFGVEF